MYRQQQQTQTSIKVNNSYLGETIEQKVTRITVNKEPIKDNAPRIYTERKDGVNPDHDIRTDRWEHAIDAMDLVSRTKIASREQRIGEATYDTMTAEQQKEFVKKFPNSKIAKGKTTEGTE